MDKSDRKSPAIDQLKTENPTGQPTSVAIHPHTQKFYMLLIILGIIFLASVFTAVLYIIGARTTLNQQKQSVSQSANVQKIPTPVPDITVDWKTYTAKNMGFSIKLPPQWFSHEERAVQQAYEATFSFPVDNPSSQSFIAKQKAQIYITLRTNIKNTAYQEISEIANNPVLKWKTQINMLNIDREKAYFIDSLDNHSRLLLFVHNKSRYMLVFSTGKGTDLEYPNVKLDEILPVFNQILSTFKFLD